MNFKIAVMALAIGLFAVSCGGSGSKQQSSDNASETKSVSNKSGNKQIITEQVAIAEDSPAWRQFQAKSTYEKFIFNGDALSQYVKIYIFRDDADKEDALEMSIKGGFDAKIDGETLVIVSETYRFFPCSKFDFDGIKERLNEDNVKFSVK